MLALTFERNTHRARAFREGSRPREAMSSRKVFISVLSKKKRERFLESSAFSARSCRFRERCITRPT
jgi:hypothetical protein